MQRMRRRATPLGDGWFSYQRSQPRRNGGRRSVKYSIRRKPNQPYHQPRPIAPLHALIPTPIPHQLQLSRTTTVTHTLNPTVPHKANAQYNTPNHKTHLLSPHNSQPHQKGAITMHLSHTRPAMPLTTTNRTQNQAQHPTLNAPTYQDVLLAQAPEPHGRFRFQQPIWHYYVNQDPWYQLQVQGGPREIPQPLPLPPDPTHPAWRGRCFNCLIFGHDQSDCRDPDRVCAICWQKGHQAKYCRGIPAEDASRVDPLQPTGNIGDAGLPTDRPERLNVYVPETPSIRADIQDLQQAVIVDARLKPNHIANKLQAILMAICQVEVPFRITQLTDFQCLVLLPQNACRRTFMDDYSAQLHGFGYVPYQWTPSSNGAVLELRFKVWVELQMQTPLGWNIESLLPVTSTFGALLDHTTLTNARAINNFTAVVAVPSLQEIPHEVRMWIRGVAWPVMIKVKGWCEETFASPQHENTAPPAHLFSAISEANSQDMAAPQPGKSIVPVEFDILYEVWERMEPGAQQDKLEITLKASSGYEVKQKQLLLEAMREAKEMEEAMAADAAEAVAKEKAEGKKPVQMDGSNTSTGGVLKATNRIQDAVKSAVPVSEVPYSQNRGVPLDTAAPVTSANRADERDTPKVHAQPFLERKDTAAIKKAKGALVIGQAELNAVWKRKEVIQQAQNVTQLRNGPSPIGPSSINIAAMPWLNNPLPVIPGLPVRPFEQVDLLHNPILEAHIDSLIDQQEQLYQDLQDKEDQTKSVATTKGEGTSMVQTPTQAQPTVVTHTPEHTHSPEQTEGGDDNPILANPRVGDRDDIMEDAEGEIAGEEDDMEEDGIVKETVDGLTDSDQEYEEASKVYENDDEFYEDDEDLAQDVEVSETSTTKAVV